MSYRNKGTPKFKCRADVGASAFALLVEHVRSVKQQKVQHSWWDTRRKGSHLHKATRPLDILGYESDWGGGSRVALRRPLCLVKVDGFNAMRANASKALQRLQVDGRGEG